MRALTPAESRIAALLLALVVLVLAWLLLLQWWFVTPQLRMAAQMDELRSDQQRYAAIVAQRDAVRQRLAGLARGQADSSAFLAEDDPNAATAGLMQRVVDAAAARAALGPCTVTQKMAVPARDDRQPYRKVSANINMRCGTRALAAVLYDLEHGTPYLFIDNFSAYRNPVPASDGSAQPLEVQMTLSGYLRGSARGTP
jgi:general secretion pathway protein M